MRRPEFIFMMTAYLLRLSRSLDLSREYLSLLDFSLGIVTACPSTLMSHNQVFSTERVKFFTTLDA